MSYGRRAQPGGRDVEKAGGRAPILDGADVKDTAFLSDLNAIGEVSALGATIGGVLNLKGARLTNEGRAALVLRSARLNGFRLTPAAVNGTIALDAAQITVMTTPNDMGVLAGSKLSASG
jgi:hypothetical protein